MHHSGATKDRKRARLWHHARSALGQRWLGRAARTERVVQLLAREVGVDDPVEYSVALQQSMQGNAFKHMVCCLRSAKALLTTNNGLHCAFRKHLRHL